MSDKYQAWIEVNYPTKDAAHMACETATIAMCKAFPELSRVRGHYIHMGLHPHWWCVTPEGEVVDPTAKQYPDGGIYMPLPDDFVDPIGKCCECGEYIFDGEGDSQLHFKCETAYMAYMNGARL